MLSEHNIVLFDGVCNLCNGFVQFVLKKDVSNQIKFGSLESKVGKELLKKFEIDTCRIDSIVFISNEKVFVKSQAVFMILKLLDQPWKGFVVFQYFPRKLNDFIYDVIAKNRYNIFGKKNRCWIPTKELQSKFLLLTLIMSFCI